MVRLVSWEEIDEFAIKTIGRHFPLEMGKRTLIRWYLRRALARKTGSAIVTTPSDVQFALDLSSEIELYIYLTGWWEKTDCRIALSNLGLGDTCIDAGAHIGFFALNAARVLGLGGHVYAFEPNPPIYERLQRNVALNSPHNVSALPVALAEQEGTAKFYSPTGARSGDASFYTTYTRDGLPAPMSIIEVNVTTLDTFCSNAGVHRVNFLKIDTEGAEPEVLRGATRVIRKHKPVIMAECNAQALSASGSSVSDLLAHLWSLEYDIWQRAKWGRRLTPVRSASDVGPICNIHCFPRT